MSAKNGKPRGRVVKHMTVVTPVYCRPELKELAVIEAEKQEIPLSELFGRAMANYLGCPELGIVPRKRPGRKPSKITSVAN